ncbi:MAG: HEAT repeat domain-containing protein, partial [Promethearchaeota archaeon]
MSSSYKSIKETKGKTHSADFKEPIIEKRIKLGKIENKSIKKLIKSLKKGNEESRRRVKQALVAFGEEAVEILLSILKYEKNKIIQAEVAEVLGLIKSEKAVLGLIEALSDDYDKLRENAVIAL